VIREKALDERDALCYGSRYRRRSATGGPKAPQADKGPGKSQTPDTAMPMSVSPQANRLGRLSQLLDTYVHALLQKPLPEDPAKRAEVADRDIRSVEIILRCEERMQAMMAPSKPADGEEHNGDRERDEHTLEALKRRLDQRLTGGQENGLPGKP
jgi:hypothetical protein